MRNIYIDTHSVGRSSFDRAENHSIKVHFKRNINSHTSKSKERERAESKGEREEGRDIQSLLERRSLSRKRRTDENDYRGAVNRMVKENRRLQTEHVREVYGKDSIKKELEVSEMFWKKKNPNATNKGQTRYIQHEKGLKSSKKCLKNTSN